MNGKYGVYVDRAKPEPAGWLEQVRGAVRHWRSEAAAVKALPSEIRMMRDSFEFME